MTRDDYSDNQVQHIRVLFVSKCVLLLPLIPHNFSCKTFFVDERHAFNKTDGVGSSIAPVLFPAKINLYACLVAQRRQKTFVGKQD